MCPDLRICPRGNILQQLPLKLLLTQLHPHNLHVLLVLLLGPSAGEGLSGGFGGVPGRESEIEELVYVVVVEGVESDLLRDEVVGRGSFHVGIINRVGGMGRFNVCFC